MQEKTSSCLGSHFLCVQREKSSEVNGIGLCSATRPRAQLTWVPVAFNYSVFVYGETKISGSMSSPFSVL